MKTFKSLNLFLFYFNCFFFYTSIKNHLKNHLSSASPLCAAVSFIQR